MPEIIDPKPAVTGPRSVFAAQLGARHGNGSGTVSKETLDAPHDRPHPAANRQPATHGSSKQSHRNGRDVETREHAQKSSRAGRDRRGHPQVDPELGKRRKVRDRGQDSDARHLTLTSTQTTRPHINDCPIKSTKAARISKVAGSFVASPPPEGYVPQALGIDARPGQSPHDEDDSDKASLLLSFLSSLKARVAGISRSPAATAPRQGQPTFPNWVTTTAATSSGVVALEDLDLNNIALSISLDPPVQKRKRNVLIHPEGMSLAAASWEAMGNLVTRLVERNTRGRGDSPKEEPPIRITLLTYQDTLLADHENPTSIESHQRAIGDWRRRLQPYWDKGQLGQVHVVVITTASETWGGDTRGICRKDSSAVPSTLVRLLRAAQAECQRKFEKPYVVHPVLAPGETGAILTVMPHCTISYQHLVRSWLHPYLPVQGTQLELPATTGGAQCVIQLTASYHTLPFAVNSVDFERLRVDLRRINRLTVVQSIPVPTVDASLLFGVPMTVEVAMQDNWEATLDMERLLQALLRYLLQNQVALLLVQNGGCGAGSPGEVGLFDGTGAFGNLSDNSKGKVGDDNSKSKFVFLPRVVTAGAMTSGLLFRYADTEHLTADASNGCIGSPKDIGPTMSKIGERSDFDSYMEECLDCMLAPHNPVDEVQLRRKAEPQRTGKRNLSSLASREVDDWVRENKAQNDDESQSDGGSKDTWIV